VAFLRKDNYNGSDGHGLEPLLNGESRCRDGDKKDEERMKVGDRSCRLQEVTMRNLF
jgi:hypothetical protein